jgi:hypothetical protein
LFTSGLPRSTSDTVARDMPQPAAMSFNVTLRPIGVWCGMRFRQVRTIQM